MSPRACLLSLVTVVSLNVPLFAAVEVAEKGDVVRVEIDGKLFTELHIGTDAPHVYYWPVIGPGGVQMTRHWPMEDVPNESHDHPHHRSMWFSHGRVNGVDFWGEDISYKTKPAFQVGKIVNEKVVEAKGGADFGILTTSQKWVTPDGEVPVTSVQTMKIYQRPDSERLFDFEVTVTAGAKDAVFGDTKEGSFGMRLAESMRLTAADKKVTGEGHILNSEGLTDDKVWGQRANWVEMSGPIEGKTYGVAIFSHPSNLRSPTRWHARDYGLFAPNPFCEHDMDKTQPEHAGDYTLPAGQSLTLKYRVWIHEGAADGAKLAEQFKEYSAH